MMMNQIAVFLLSLFFVFNVFAQEENDQNNAEVLQDTKIEIIYGRGRSFGQCDGGALSSFCISQLKTQSEREGEQDAKMQCSFHSGIPQFSPRCYTNCSPPSIPNNGQMQIVNCSSDCQMNCEVKN